MSSWKKVLVAFFLMLLLHDLQYALVQDDPAARGIMKKCLTVYKNLRTYQEQLIFQWRAEIHGLGITNLNKGEVSNVIEIAIAKPNRIRFWQSGDFAIVGSSIVCDGRRIWEYMPLENKFTNDESPMELHEIVDDHFMFIAQYVAMENDFVIPMLFDPESAQKNLDRFQVVAFEKDKNAPSMSHLHLILTTETKEFRKIIDLWLEAKTFLISHSKETEIDTIKTGKNPITHERVTEYFHNNIQINKQINPEVFRFSPPANSEETISLFDAFSFPGEEKSPKRYLEGNSAPEIELPDLLSGKVHRLAGLQGLPTVLFIFRGKDFDFLHEILKHVQILKKLTIGFRGKPVRFLGISMKSTKEETLAAMRKIGVDIPIALDLDGKVSTAFNFGSSTPPFWVIIDKSGVVRKTFVGSYSRQGQIITSLLNSLL